VPITLDPSLVTDVRTTDYDRFLAIQLAHAAARAALYAVTAFHGELARISDTVSEPLLGHIRLAWWREALEELAVGKAPRAHPVVQALAGVHAAHPALMAELQRPVAARASDLEQAPFTDEAAWLAYCDATAGALHRAWALLLDADAAEAHAESIAAQARGYAIIGHLRAVPYQASRRRMPFPKDAVLEALAPGDAMARVAQHLTAQAEGMLVYGALPRRGLRPLIGLQRLAMAQARHLRHAQYNAFTQPSSKLASAWCAAKVNIM